MLVKSTKLTLGPILAFNDLPSTITAEFTIENARSWGMQEIMAKFNSGYLRTVDVQKTFFETQHYFSGDIEKGEEEKWTHSEPAGILPGEPFSVPVAEVKNPENAAPADPKFAPASPDKIVIMPANFTPMSDFKPIVTNDVGLNSIDGNTGNIILEKNNTTPSTPMKRITMPEGPVAPGSEVLDSNYLFISNPPGAAQNSTLLGPVTDGLAKPGAATTLPGGVSSTTTAVTAPGVATAPGTEKLVAVDLGTQINTQSKQIGGAWP